MCRIAGEYGSTGKEGVAVDMMDKWQFAEILSEGSMCSIYAGAILVLGSVVGVEGRGG